MIADIGVRHAAAETVAPAFGVEPQQMIAILVGFADPQFPDQAAIGQRFVQAHSDLLTFASEDLLIASPPRDARATNGLRGESKPNAAMQQN